MHRKDLVIPEMRLLWACSFHEMQDTVYSEAKLNYNVSYAAIAAIWQQWLLMQVLYH